MVRAFFAFVVDGKLTFCNRDDAVVVVEPFPPNQSWKPGADPKISNAVQVRST